MTRLPPSKSFLHISLRLTSVMNAYPFDGSAAMAIALDSVAFGANDLTSPLLISSVTTAVAVATKMCVSQSKGPDANKPRRQHTALCSHAVIVESCYVV